MLSETKVQRGILLFADPMTNEMVNKMNSLLTEHNTNTFFYMVYNEVSVDNNDMKTMTSNGPFHMNWNQVSLVNQLLKDKNIQRLLRTRIENITNEILFRSWYLRITLNSFPINSSLI